MKKLDFEEALDRITERDPRYHAHAYHVMREALDYTIQMLEKPTAGPGRHVSGQELLKGIQAFTLREYGPMAKRVLNYWGISANDDFGNLVFNLVDEGILGRTESDRREDFHGGPDFEQVFIKPYLPTWDRLDGETATEHNKDSCGTG